MTFIATSNLPKRKAFSLHTDAGSKHISPKWRPNMVVISLIMAYNVLESGDKWGKVGIFFGYLTTLSLISIEQVY